MLDIATALGEEEKGHVLVQSLRTRWSAINQLVPPVRGHLGVDADGLVAGRPRVACLQWLSPLMGAGYWVPGIVACAGGKNVTGQVRRRAEVTASVCLMSVHCDGLDSRAGAFCVETTLNIGPVDLFETVKQVKECGR